MQRRWFLYTILTAWMILFVYSFYAVDGVEPTGDGFVRGMNRVSLFLRWHASALAFAIAAAFVGWRAQSPARRWLSKAPVAAHLLLTLGVLGYAYLEYQRQKRADNSSPAATENMAKPKPPHTQLPDESSVPADKTN